MVKKLFTDLHIYDSHDTCVQLYINYVKLSKGNVTWTFFNFLLCTLYVYVKNNRFPSQCFFFEMDITKWKANPNKKYEKIHVTAIHTAYTVCKCLNVDSTWWQWLLCGSEKISFEKNGICSYSSIFLFSWWKQKIRNLSSAFRRNWLSESEFSDTLVERDFKRNMETFDA